MNRCPGCTSRHSGWAGLQWGLGVSIFYSDVGNQAWALWSQRSGSVDIASRCVCRMLYEPPFCSVVAAATANYLTLWLHPCYLLVARDALRLPPNFLHTALPVSGLCCSWLVPLWAEREMFPSPLIQSSPHGHFPRWLAMGIFTSSEKKSHLPTKLWSVFMVPTRYSQEEPHVKHFPASHSVPPRITLSPHSEMRTDNENLIVPTSL